MARRLGWLLSGAAVALGLGHLAVTFLAFERMSLDALWFAGSGLAIILGGIINLFALLASHDSAGRALLGIANLAMTAFVALILFLAPEPQVIIGLILFAGLTALSWHRRPRTA